MTKKHKISKSKHLLENKKGVDENVENILRMIGEENEQAESEPDHSGNTVKESKLSSLVKGFHEDYQFLHKHYKQLISKLENVGHSTSGSDSSDSDSEGDRSGNDVPKPKVGAEENGWKQKLAEDHQGDERSVEAETEMLKQNAEENTKEISDLKQLLDKAIKDKEAARVELSSDVAKLSSENDKLKLLVGAAEREAGESLKTLALMENEIRTLSREKEITEKERGDLKISIVDLENKGEDMSNQLQDTVEKCTFLSSQLEKAELAEKEVHTLLSENQKIKNENLMLSVECDNLKACEQNLDTECSQLKATLAEIKTHNDSLIGENHSLERKLQLFGVEIDGMTVEKEELMNNLNRERGAAAEEKERLVSEHSECLIELEKAQSSVKELERELESTKVALNDNIAELQKEKNSAELEVNQLEASLKKLENDLEQHLERTSIMQKDNEDLELANFNLHNELAAVQGQKNEAVASTIDLESKLEQQNQQISNLQEATEDLKAEVTVHQEEKNTALAQLQQAEAYLKDLQNETEQKQNQISVLQQANEELQEKSSSLDRQLEEVKTNLQTEIILLQGEKEQALYNLQQSNTSIKTVEHELEQQRVQNYILQRANEDLQKSNSNLKKQFEDAIVSLHAEILALQEEKNKTFSELQQSEASIKNLGIELEQGREQISILHLSNEDMKNSNASLDKQLEESRTSLREEIAALREEKETALSELQQSLASIRNFERELEKQGGSISALQQANDDLQKNNCALTEQFEEVKVESQKEIKVTQEEKDTVLTQLKQSEFSIKNLECEIAQLKEDLSIQLENNSSLDKQLEESRTSLHAEILALREEKETALSELQQSQASVRSFERELEKQSESISALQQANDELQKNNCALTEQLEEVKVELQKEIKVTQEEKDTGLTQLKQSESSIKNLESEIAQLREDFSIQLENNSSLEKQLEEAILKVSNLHEKLEKVQAEAASQINDMNTNTKDLEKTIDILSSQKTKVEEDLKIMIKTCTENMSFMKEFEDRVEQKITDHETGLACLQQSLREILSSCQRLHHAYDEVSTRAFQLEVLKKNQIERIDQLEERNTEILDRHRHLEDEKLYANKENAKLQKHVQELEVQLQLAKQKLKVTEAESKCNEDSYMMAVETSQAEIGHLKQQIQQFSGRISSLEETLVEIKENAESGVSKLADQSAELESHFSQSFAHFIARLFACSEELKLLKKKLHDHLDEQKELLKENDELAIRLRKKEEVMSEMARSAAEADEKMVQLEKKIEEKDDELAARVQEKREAIKQLSDAVDYHKNNSDDLIRYIRSHNRPRLPFCL